MNFKKKTLFIVALAGLAAALCGQSITVTAPNGGERWLLGDPVSITWSSAGLSGDVRITLLRSGGAVVGTIAAAVPAGSGNFTWEAGALATGAAIAGENYLVRVRTASGETTDESNAAFALVARLPNIRIGSMREIGWDHTFLPRLFSAGDTVTIQFHLRNDSDYAAGPFHVGLRLGGAIVARQAFSELVNGADANGEFTWTAVCGSAIAIVADCDSEVEENNEGDNVMTDPGLACTQPDLNFFSALSCSSGGATLKAGLPYEFRAQVDSTPVGAENVRVTGGVVGGAMLYDHTFPAMAGDGGLETVSFIWEIPAGAQRVYFEIDPGNSVSESNERNNRQELAVTAVVSTPATEHYDLRISIDRARSFGARLGEINLPLGRPVTIYGEVRGATGSIRDFKVTGTVLGREMLRMAKVYEHDFVDPGKLAVPFSFTWTPDIAGDFTITVKAALGPHAVGVGVVDSDPANNAASVVVHVAKPKPSLR